MVDRLRLTPLSPDAIPSCVERFTSSWNNRHSEAEHNRDSGVRDSGVRDSGVRPAERDRPSSERICAAERVTLAPQPSQKLVWKSVQQQVPPEHAGLHRIVVSEATMRLPGAKWETGTSGKLSSCHRVK